MDSIKRNPDYRNYSVICAAIEFVEEKLKPYTDRKLQETHQEIKKKMTGQPKCTQQCSVTLKNRTAQWCISCKNWKTHLMKSTNKPTTVAWENMNSNDWPDDYEEIVDVYLPPSCSTRNYQDLSTACHIWSSMKSCKIDAAVLRRIRNVRNQYFAHNPFRTATVLEKSITFDTFTDLFKDQDVTPYIDTNDCLHGLSVIENGVGADRQMSNIEIQLQQLQDTQEENKKFSILRQFCSLLRWWWKNFNERRLLDCIVIIACIFYICMPTWKGKHQECISEQYSVPFQQDLPLFPYLTGQSTFIGRKWLFKELHSYLLPDSPNENTTGIIIAAEMGYGKSAIVSELLCPNIDQEKAQDIRKHIVAFHVCKFDVRTTHDPARLIRRIVGFLAMKSAEFGNRVSMLPESSLLYDKEGCAKEPEACFDQGITFPLKHLKNIENPPWIIAIDALDECETSGHNDILQLLIRRTNTLPKWLKLVITSRNMTSLSRFRQIKLKYLESNDQRNLNDLKTFINLHLPEYHSKTRFIDDLLANSDGNFVYIFQAVSWLLSKNDSKLPELPADLGNVYEINFDRQFGYGKLYAVPKKILEIVCSTINPVDKTDIYAILIGNGALCNATEFNNYFNTLSFFVNVDNGVRVKHQALFYWLTSETNLHYRISLQAGHAQISTYLFSISNANKSVDLVDLAVHVGNSDDSNLKKIFIASQMVSEDIVNKKNLLHKLVWKTSAVKPLELILEQLQYVDKLNEGNVTAAFVAASKGNVDQLKLLHKKGGDIYFRVYGNFRIHSGNITYKIDMMKRLYYSGYTMLHIAAQHGHLDVVRYLLQQNITFLHLKNSLGLHAGHVACENGHIHVIEEMSKFDPKLFGYKCLYYGSKHNHKHVVEWLVSRGVKFKCISNQKSKDALNEMQSVSTGMVNLPRVIFADEDNTFPTINPFDTWWIIYKFNPLLEAIHAGSLTTAAFLIDSYPDALDCRDAFGFSAALSSVVYNRSDLFSRIIDKITTEKCHKIPLHIVNSSQHDIVEMSKKSLCPKDGGLAHILALYPSEHQLHYFARHHFHAIQWNVPDKLGNYPIHFAVSNNNLLFIRLIRDLIVINDIRTRNGSTPYHIAVKNGNLFTLRALTDSFNFSIPKLKDKNQQGILHHVVQMQFDDQTATFEKEKQGISLLMFDILVNKFGHDLILLDVYGRNILHYALKYGHFQIINDLIQTKNAEFKFLLHQRDSDGYHPVEYSLKMYKRDEYLMVIKEDHCAYYEVFSRFCIKDFDQLAEYMSSWELSVYLVIANMSYSELQLLLEPVLSHIWLKSSYLMTAVMFIHKYHNEQILRQLVIQHEVTGVTKFNQFMLVHYFPSVYHVCGETLEKSPLHYIMLSFDIKDTLFGINEIYKNVALEVLFPKQTAKTGPSCNDKDSYSIFHVSLMGGNIEGARLLLNRGIEIFDNHLSLRDIILMALKASTRSIDNNLLSMSQESRTDWLLMELLMSHKDKFEANDICVNGSSDLSLIHLLTANGMLRTVKLLVKMFSLSILNCKNVDGFTPLYLGKLFSKHEILSLTEKNINITIPRLDAELYLLLYVLKGVPKAGSADVLNPFMCTARFLSPYRQNKKWYHCMNSVLSDMYILANHNWLTYSILAKHALDLVESVEICINVFEMLLRAPVDGYATWSTFYFNCQASLSYIIYDFRSLGYFKDVPTTIVRRKLIARFLGLCNNGHKNDKKLDCTKEPRWKFRSFFGSLRGLTRRVKSVVQRMAIQFYLQGKQTIPINVSHSYEFLQQRLEEHHVNTSRYIRDSETSVDSDIYLNFNHFQYLEILKSMFSVKGLINYTRLIKMESHSIETLMLIEPFEDLK